MTYKDLVSASSQFTEKFFSSGNIFRGSQYSNKGDNTSLSVTERVNFRKIHLLAGGSFRYDDTDHKSETADSTYQLQLTNIETTTNNYKNRNIFGSVYASWSKTYPSGDDLMLSANASAANSDPYNNRRNSQTYYANTGGLQIQNLNSDQHASSYSYRLNCSYQMVIGKAWNTSLGMNYNQYQSNKHNTHNNTVGDIQETDLDNSYTHSHLNRDYQFEINITRPGRNNRLNFRLPFTQKNEQMDYHHHRLDTAVRRTVLVFEPRFVFQSYGQARKDLSYTVQVTQPQFEDLMPYRNTLYATTVRINNTGLKNRIKHQLKGYLSFRKRGTDLNYWVGADADYYQRGWGTRTGYDRETGVYTYMNDNVDGSWNGNVRSGFNRSLDKKHLFRIDAEANVRYTHSVDYDIAQDITMSNLSHVNTVGPGAVVRLNCRLGTLSLGANARYTDRFSRGDTENFQDINASDYQYGLTAQYTIPLLRISLATDITMYSRRGYNSSIMNTDDLVWNALLSRTMLKNRLTLKLQAYDILHQVSNKRYHVDAQGRTETWYNSLPSYLMVSVSYRFHHMPRKNTSDGGGKSVYFIDGSKSSAPPKEILDALQKK